MLQLITSNLFCCLILIVVTTIAAVAIWKVLITVFRERKQYELIYAWMKITLFISIVPVVYLSDKVVYGWKTLTGVRNVLEKGQQMWYMYSGSYLGFVRIFLPVWLIGVAAVVCYFLYCKSRLNRMLAFREKVRDERVLDQFRKIKNQVGITSSITLYECPYIVSPFVQTWNQQTVIIPEGSYTDKTLQAMFTHELLHIKNKDYRKKQWVTAACCIQWFNPLIWWFFSEMDMWCEIACDCEAVKLLKGKISKRGYFIILLELVNQNGRKNKKLISSVSDSKKEWARRYFAVQEGQQVKHMKKGTMAVATVLLVTLMSSTVYGAGLQMDRVNAQYTLDAAVQYDEEYAGEECKEIIETLTEEQMAAIRVDEDAFGSTEARGLSDQVWDLDPGESIRSAFAYFTEGDTVRMVGLINPTDVEMKIGLLSISGVIIYIRVTDMFAHTFTIPFTGVFAIYAENLGSKTSTTNIYVQ